MSKYIGNSGKLKRKVLSEAYYSDLDDLKKEISRLLSEECTETVEFRVSKADKELFTLVYIDTLGGINED